MTCKGLKYKKLSIMGSHPNSAKWWFHVIASSGSATFRDGYRSVYFAAHCMIHIFRAPLLYLRKLRTKRPASCFNAIHCRLCLCQVPHQTSPTTRCSLMLFPSHHMYDTCTFISFLSLIFRVGVCRHLTYPIISLDSLALTLPRGPATYRPRRRRVVPTFDLPNIPPIFFGTHCITFCPPGPLRPGDLSRSPSIYI